MSDLSTYTREDSRLAAVPLPQKDGLPVPRHGIRSQLILLAGLLGLSLVLTMASLFWSGYSQDKIALENSRHLAGTALKVQLSTLQKIITDYTYWDEAYLKTVEKFDPSWFDENFADGEYLGDTFGITTTFVVNSHNKILRHMRNSEIFENPSQLDTADYFKDGISKLIKTARHSIDGEFEAAAGLVKMDRQFYIATARVIHPHSDALLAKAAVTPSNAFVVAVMRPLGSALLEKIAEDFGLQDLRFVRSDDPSSRLPLQIMEGERFGALAWEIDLPSKYVMEVILPGFLAVIISVGWLGWYGLNSLRQSQMQQFAAMQQAQIADRSKTEFLANMSHELRTPLNAIIGFSELMKGEAFGPLGDERYNEYSAHIHDSGAHLLDIINDVLDLSNVESGNFDLREGEISLPTVIGSVKQFIGPRADEKGIALDVNLAPDLPTVLADDGALKQILLNLLSNAIKFTPPAGNVNVGVKFDRDGAVEIAVSDTGCGIPGDQLPLVMRPFHQVDGYLTKSEGGTGLGLALSASLVALHGGKMRIDSEVDKGTTVIVTLPIERLAA